MSLISFTVLDPCRIISGTPEQFPCVDYVSNDYAVFYTELENALPLSLERQPYYSIPSLFTLLGDSAMEAAGIVSALQTPALSNMGSGVIIGIVDTGIDYTSPVFLKSDGTTRILGLWDQTLPEDPSVFFSWRTGILSHGRCLLWNGIHS